MNRLNYRLLEAFRLHVVHYTVCHVHHVLGYVLTNHFYSHFSK